MKQEEISNLMCKQKWHPYPISHFAVGESKCRHCDIFWTADWTGNLCPICHWKLSYKSRTK